MTATGVRRGQATLAGHALPYDHLGAGERYLHETRDRAFLALLRRHGITRLAGLRVLELGCGEGALQRSLLHYGADERLLGGIDIDAGNVACAALARPSARLIVGDAGSLPYATGVFDLALAFTMFTSVLDREVRARAASEALRVLRPGGLLVVYDFQVNPFNPRVRPLRAGELRELFSSRPVEIERVTLAPPIARALGRWRSLCAALERAPLLRTHLLAAVVKEGAS